MKVAISIPDPTGKAADRLARKLKLSRSRLYAEAVGEYIQKRNSSAITEAINRVEDSLTEEEKREHHPLMRAALRSLPPEKW